MRQPDLRLYKYQEEDVVRLRTILWDSPVAWNLNEQRTGKLVTFIALCDEFWGDYCRDWQGAIGTEHFAPFFILVVAPLSTLWNVRDEFERWLGWKVVINPDWGPSQPGYDEPGDMFTDQPIVVAINREKLRDPNHWLFSFKWDLVLLDEAHHYRGRKSQQTEGAFRLARGAWKTVLATGTPLMNGRPAELWPLLHITDRKKWSSFWKYLGEFAADIPAPSGPYQDPNAPWRRGAKDKMKKILAPIVLRRTYAEVKPDLPPVVTQTIKLDLSQLDPNHWRAYQELEKEWATTIGDTEVEASSTLSLIMRLRQLAASPRNLDPSGAVGGKVKAIADYVADVQGKVVLFAWHKAMAWALHTAIERSCEPVTGDTSPDKRVWVCDRFQQSSDDDVLLATIATLKEGISLDSASTLIFAERSYVPAENDQAAARILGPGQQGSPLVVTFVVENSIEEDVERILARKDKVTSEFMLFSELLHALTEPIVTGGHQDEVARDPEQTA